MIPRFFSRPRSTGLLVAMASLPLACSPAPPAGEGRGMVEPAAQIESPVEKILLVSIDCARPDHFGVYGYPRPTTPTIDALAAEGVVFTRAFAQANWTKPSVASLFSGLYPRHHGVTVGRHMVLPDGTKEERTVSFPSDVPSLGQAFTDAGWRTAGFVENSHISEQQGFGRGFEVYGRLKPAARHFRKWFSDLDEADKVFAYVHFIGPHDPYVIKKGKAAHYRDRFPTTDSTVDFSVLTYKKRSDLTPADIEEARALYDTELAYFDGDHVAHLFETLRDAGQFDDFLIIVTADHGEELYDRGGWAHGHSLHQEVVRIPLVVRLPVALRARNMGAGPRFEETIIEQIDLFPTLGTLADIEVPDGLDGVDQTALFLAPPTPDNGDPPFAISEHVRHDPTWVSGVTLLREDRQVIFQYEVPHASQLAHMDGQQLLGLPGGDQDLETAFKRDLAFIHQEMGKPSVTVRDNTGRDYSEEERRELEALGYVE